MKKAEAINSFKDGLILDLNPIIVPNTALTGALNATITTNNGNEGLLQNDMGNARVKDAVLPEGYVPIGTCEYGGIIYIVSHNPKTKYTLIGSFPSPLKMFDTSEITSITHKASSISNSNFILGNVNSVRPEDYTITSTEKILELMEDNLHPNDSYAVVFDGSTNVSLELIEGLNETLHPNVRITPISIEESGNTTELKPDLSDYFIQLTKEGEDPIYSKFSSKVSGRVALKFNLLVPNEIYVTYNIVQTPENKYKVVWVFNWKGEGDPQKFQIKESTSEIIDGKEQSSESLNPYYFDLNWTNASLSKEDEEKYKSIKFEYDNNGNLIPYKEDLYDDVLNRYNKGVVKLDNTKIYAKENKVTYFDVTPVMAYGKLPDLTQLFKIDWSKVNTGAYDLTTWKYYKYNDFMDISFNLELYPTYNKVIDHIDLEILDILGTTFTYKILNREAYSGSYNIDLPLNAVRQASDIEVAEKHVGLEVIDLSNYSTNITYSLLRYNGKNDIDSISGITPNNIKDTFDLVDVKDGKYKLESAEDIDDNWTSIESTDRFFINDTGVLYSNNCYIVKFKIYDRITSIESESNEIPAKTITRILWTNGVFNDKYYNTGYKDFKECKIQLMLASHLEHKVVDKSQDILNDTTGSIYHLNKTENYKIESSITNGLQNSYNSFSLNKYKEEGEQGAKIQNLVYIVDSLSNELDIPTAIDSKDQDRDLTYEENSYGLTLDFEELVQAQESADYIVTEDDLVRRVSTGIDLNLETKFTLNASVFAKTPYSQEEINSISLMNVYLPILYNKKDLDKYGFYLEHVTSYLSPLSLELNNVLFSRVINWARTDDTLWKDKTKLTTLISYKPSVVDLKRPGEGPGSETISTVSGVLTLYGVPTGPIFNGVQKGLLPYADNDTTTKLWFDESFKNLSISHDGENAMSSYLTNTPDGSDFYTKFGVNTIWSTDGSPVASDRVSDFFGKTFVLLLAKSINTNWQMATFIEDANGHGHNEVPGYDAYNQQYWIYPNRSDNKLAVGFIDAKNLMHLTNTFYDIFLSRDYIDKEDAPYSYKYPVNPANEIVSMLCLVYYNTGSKQSIKIPNTIYIPEHFLNFSKYIIIKSKYIYPEDSKVPDKTSLLLNNHLFTDIVNYLRVNLDESEFTENVNNLSYEFIDAVSTASISFQMGIETPNVMPIEGNTYVKTVFGEDKIIGSDASSGLYLFDGENLTKIDGGISFNYYNEFKYKEGTETLLATYDKNKLLYLATPSSQNPENPYKESIYITSEKHDPEGLRSCSNFSDIFIFNNNKELRLSQSYYSPEKDYFSFITRNQHGTKYGGWLYCLKNESLIDGRSYEQLKSPRNI